MSATSSHVRLFRPENGGADRLRVAVLAPPWIEVPPPESEGVLGIYLGNASDRGHGIGTAAVELAVAEFRRAHPQLPVVLRVRRSNADAVSCYRRVGFAVTSRGCKTLPSGEVVPYYRMVLPAG